MVIDGIFRTVCHVVYIFCAPAIQRIHSDKEGEVVDLSQELERHIIAATFTHGGGPTAAGENAVARLCRLARSSLMHIDDRRVRRKLWPMAMAHAEYLSTLQSWKLGRIQLGQVVPFGCLSVFYTKSTIQESNKIDKAWKRGIALHPSAAVPNAYEIEFVADDV